MQALMSLCICLDNLQTPNNVLRSVVCVFSCPLVKVRAYYPDPVPRPPPLPIPLWPSEDAKSQHDEQDGIVGDNDDDADDNGSLNGDSVGSLNPDGADDIGDVDAPEAAAAAASADNPTLDQPFRLQPVVSECAAGPDADFYDEATAPSDAGMKDDLAPFSTASPLASPASTQRNEKANFSSAASVSSIGSLDRSSLAGSLSLDSTNGNDDEIEEMEPPVHSVVKRREAALRLRQVLHARRAAEAAAAESAYLKAQPWRKAAALAARKRAGGALAPRAANRAFASVAAAAASTTFTGAATATAATVPAAPATSPSNSAAANTAPLAKFESTASSSTQWLPVERLSGYALLAELRGRFGFLGFDKDPDWALKGRPLMSRTYALREQGGLSLLHLASFLGHGNVAVALLEAEDNRMGWSPAKAVAAAAAAAVSTEVSAVGSVAKAAAAPIDGASPEAATADDISGADASPTTIAEDNNAAGFSIPSEKAELAQTQEQQTQQQPQQPQQQRRMHDALDRRGRTPLHLACHTWPHFRQARLVAALLERGADPNARDALGRTPLHYACRSLDHGAIAQLLAAGADPFVEALPGGYPADDVEDNSSVGGGDTNSGGSDGNGVSNKPAGPLWARGGDGNGGRGAPAASPAAVAVTLSLTRDQDTPSQLAPPVSPQRPPSLQNLSQKMKAALKGPRNSRDAAFGGNLPGIRRTRKASVGASTAMVLTPHSGSSSRRDSRRHSSSSSHSSSSHSRRGSKLSEEEEEEEEEPESDEVSPIAEGQLPGDLRSGGLKFGAKGPYAFGAGPPRGATPLMYTAPAQRGECFAILSKGLLPDEATLLLAPLLAQAWVHAKVLKPFDRTDPVTKRSLAKAHAMKACDFPYYLLVTGHIPRGASKDPRPGQKAMDKAAAKAAKDKAKGNRGGGGGR